MSKKFSYTLQKSHAKYKAILEKSTNTQQCSYNLPLDLEDELNRLKALDIEKKIGGNISYEAKWNICLGDNILALIGEGYKDKNKVVFMHTEDKLAKNKKFQLIKTAFIKKKDPSYNWFPELYDKNVENLAFVVIVDDANQKIKFDIEITPQFLSNLIATQKVNINISRINAGINKIYYGAPGCGKSFYVHQLLTDARVDTKHIVRTTFHPEYSNSDFVGQIFPSIEKEIDPVSGAEKEIVTYKFRPGPFTIALLRALDTTNMVYLIIEELNRGDAAAIFGDIFQLLDREKDINNNNFCASQYPISNPNIEKFLKDELDLGEDYQLVIPGNLTILATMNSSDQNVFTLDTAFKRRWSFEQISNDIKTDKSHSYKDWYIPGTDVTWEKFLITINEKILKSNQLNEDKRLGKYFVTKECLTETVRKIVDVRDKAQDFAYKVLEYIWNDVCKINRIYWFDTAEYRTLEDVINAFINPPTPSGGTTQDSPLAIFDKLSF